MFSFEFFPPKTEDGVDNLFERMDRMVAHNPSFCDITWGAGGTTADLTLEIANKMQNIVCVETMMHLTCTNMPVEKIDHALHTIKSNGLQNVLALRGDQLDPTLNPKTNLFIQQQQQQQQLCMYPLTFNSRIRKRVISSG